jgi:hypothetical protein
MMHRILRRMPQASSQVKNTLHTPAPRQATFECPHCARRCYSSAGLKNHLHWHALHKEAADSASEHLSESPQHSYNEEEHPMDVDFDSDVQLPPAFPNAYHDGDGYNSEFDMNLYDQNIPTSSSSSDSNLIIPSSPHDCGPHKHRQIPANDRFLTRVYHDKLNGEIIMYFCQSKF